MIDNTLAQLLGELHALSKIPPNTYINKPDPDKTIGFQPVASNYDGHSPEKTAKEIDIFAQVLIQQIAEEVKKAEDPENKELQNKTFRDLVFINREFNQAVVGQRGDGGLQGICTTYSQHDDVHTTMKNAIEKMKAKCLEALRTLHPKGEDLEEKELSFLSTYHYNPETRPYCIEEDYSDEEWEEAIIRSANLKEGFVGNYQYFVNYCLGLQYNQLRNVASSACSSLPSFVGGNNNPSWSWWSDLGQFKTEATETTEAQEAHLFLGALPLNIGFASYEKRNDLAALKEEGVRAVLSMTEVYENNSNGYFTSPVKPEEYAANGIYHLQIPTPDRETILFEKIQRSVEFIHWNIKNGRSIDVHCKAGRGRSLLAVLCYLIKYQGMTTDEAFKFAQTGRAHAGFSQESAEWQTLKVFETLYPPKGPSEAPKMESASLPDQS